MAIACALLPAVLYADRLMQVNRTHPVTRKESGDTDRSLVFVCLPGMQSDERAFDPLRSYLGRFGTVIAFGYGHKAFDSAETVRQVVRQLAPYKDRTIVLVPASKAGRVALDIHRELIRSGFDPQTLRLALIDTAAGVENVKMGGGISRLAPYLRWLRIGPILSFFPGRIVMKRWLVHAPHEKGFWWGHWWDHVLDVVTRPVLSAADFAGVVHPIIYCEGREGNTVVMQPAERKRWQAVAESAGLTMYTLTVSAGHCDFFEHTLAWTNAFGQMFELWGIATEDVRQMTPA